MVLWPALSYIFWSAIYWSAAWSLFCLLQKNIEGSPDKQDTIQSVVPAAALLFPGTTPALIIYAESDSRYQRNTSGKDCALIKQ